MFLIGLTIGFVLGIIIFAIMVVTLDNKDVDAIWIAKIMVLGSVGLVAECRFFIRKTLLPFRYMKLSLFLLKHHINPWGNVLVGIQELSESEFEEMLECTKNEQIRQNLNKIREIKSDL